MGIEIVIDTSAILAVLLSEPERDVLIRATRSTTLCVPPSVPWEVGNALTSLIRRRRLTLSEAGRAMREFDRIPLVHVNVEMGSAIKMAAKLGIYAYDAYILEATRERKCPLLTLDQGLLRAAATVGLPMVRFHDEGLHVFSRETKSCDRSARSGERRCGSDSTAGWHALRGGTGNR